MLLALKPTHLVPTGRHAGSTGQVFGAAVAAGALLKLTAQQTRYMLSYTAQQAAGITTMFRDPHHIEKAYAMGGMPAHNGVAAALMAAQGFTGVEDVYSGEPDFFLIFSPEADREALVRGLGRDYEITRQATKPGVGGDGGTNRFRQGRARVAEIVRGLERPHTAPRPGRLAAPAA